MSQEVGSADGSVVVGRDGATLRLTLNRPARRSAARLPQWAIGLAKQAIHYGQHATLSETMNHELFSLELSCRTTDFKEGLAAFRDKRPPEFSGR